MTTNEAIARYNFISKVLLKSGNEELSKDTKVKVMSMRIELSKIKKAFDADVQEFTQSIVSDEFKALANKTDRTEEEEKDFQEQNAKVNSEYLAYTQNRGQEEVEVKNTSLTEDEYEEIMSVNVSNDININGQNVPAGDFLEILYSLFVNE